MRFFFWLALLICSKLANGDQHTCKGRFKKPSSILLQVTSVNPSCGYNNGSIDVSATGGTSPYRYSLNGYVQNNGYFPGLNAAGNGSYDILVTDSLGQTVTANVILKNTLPPPNLTINTINLPTTCTSANGSVKVTGTGGVAPYRYSIDGVNFTNNNIFTNLTGGSYFFFVQDANGCITEGGIGFLGEFVCAHCCNLYANGEGGRSACKNDGQLDIVAEGGTPPYLYSIDGINYHSSTYPNNSNDFTGLPAGLYQLYVKDATNTIVTAGYQLIQSCDVSISYVSIDATCGQSDGSIILHATNGNPPFTFSIDGTKFQNDSTFNGLATGNYSVTVKDVNGTTNSRQVTVYNKCPTVTAAETDATCGQKNGTITAAGYKGTTPYQFSINGINFQASNIFTNVAQGIYNLTIKDANGFTDSTSVTVYNNCVQLSLLTVNATCSNKNGSIIATASNATAPYTYSVDGVSFQSANEFDSLAAGSYTITAKDANRLTKDSTVVLTDAPAPKLSVAVTNASCSNRNGAISINTSGGTPPLQYSIDNGTNLQSNSIFNNLDSGQYRILVKDSNSCTTKDTVQLTAPPNPKVSLGNDTTICYGQTLLLSRPALLNYQFLWQDNSTSNTFLVTGPGVYSVKVTNQFGCAISDTVNITYRALPVFSLGNDTSFCNGKTYLLQPVPAQQGSYLWSNGSTSPSININSAGGYWLQVADSGCAKKDSISITYKSNPTVSFGNDTTLCTGNSLTLNAANNNATYLWQNGSTQPTFLVISAGIYTVKVNLQGCDASGTITVDYLSKPDVTLGPDTTLCMTENLLLDVASPQSEYLWQDGSVLSHYKVTQAGVYSVGVTNSCGTTNASINVGYEDCACKFYVPNAFSPNGDGKNDIFKPGYECLFSNYEMKIFNRWGQLVFDSQNAGTGWNGNYKNEQQPSDIYIWVMAYKDNLTGKSVRKNGSVMLIR